MGDEEGGLRMVGVPHDAFFSNAEGI